MAGLKWQQESLSLPVTMPSTGSNRSRRSGKGHYLPTLWLVDDLVGARDQRGRQSDAKSFRGREVDDQFNFRGLLDSELSRLLSLENTPDVGAGLTERLCRTVAVAHQTTGRSEWAILVDRRHYIAQCQSRRRSLLTLNNGSVPITRARAPS